MGRSVASQATYTQQHGLYCKFLSSLNMMEQSDQGIHFANLLYLHFRCFLLCKMKLFHF